MKIDEQISDYLVLYDLMAENSVGLGWFGAAGDFILGGRIDGKVTTTQKISCHECTYHYSVTIPALRIFNMPLTMRTVHLIVSRFRRAVTIDNNAELETFMGIPNNIWHGSILKCNLSGYFYYDERTGAKRVYLYHTPSDTSYILKPAVVASAIVDEAGVETYLNGRTAAEVIEELIAAKAEKEKKDAED